MTSIRRHTSLLVAASIAGLLALGGLALFAVVRAALTRQFDDGLATRAAALQSLTRFDAGKTEMDIAGEIMPRYQPGADAELFVAWVREESGWRILEQSESLRNASWTLAANGPPALDVLNGPLPDGRSGRSLTVEFRPLADREAADERDASPSHAITLSPAPLVRVLVAQSRGALDRTILTIALSTASVGLALVLASIAATRWAVRRGTRPLQDLSARVAALGPGTLNQRLALGHLPAELAPVAARLNDLLARLDDAFARERRFTSAASHELRTPIAELRMLLEVGLSRERTPERWVQTAREGLGVLKRAQHLTEALLRLSRANASQRIDPTGATTDLAAMLHQQAARALTTTGHDPSHLLIDAPSTLPARIDPALAASIIGNLIDNALRHGAVSAEHPVRCVATKGDAGCSIVISNHAPALSHADLAHLFEPFWRRDAARPHNPHHDPHHNPRTGFGLGLAVSRSLTQSAGGLLAASLDPAQQLSMTLHVPSPA